MYGSGIPIAYQMKRTQEQQTALGGDSNKEYIDGRISATIRIATQCQPTASVPRRFGK